MADLEQYSRMNNVIISGLKTRHRSYASVTAPENGPAGREGDHSEPYDTGNTFTNRKNKISILKRGRKLKGTEVYINKHLTRRNGEIARRARILRKQSKIQSTWTASCKVFIKLNGTTTTEDGKVMVINDIGDLDRFNV